ncbi:hypothetical protein TNCV_1432141 [Trichonephila clavipes]|nr:hypothetical protein TNCV_1432141 [Trichonephila clavipes]
MVNFGPHPLKNSCVRYWFVPKIDKLKRICLGGALSNVICTRPLRTVLKKRKNYVPDSASENRVKIKDGFTPSLGKPPHPTCVRGVTEAYRELLVPVPASKRFVISSSGAVEQSIYSPLPSFFLLMARRKDNILREKCYDKRFFCSGQAHFLR